MKVRNEKSESLKVRAKEQIGRMEVRRGRKFAHTCAVSRIRKTSEKKKKKGEANVIYGDQKQKRSDIVDAFYERLTERRRIERKISSLENRLPVSIAGAF